MFTLLDALQATPPPDENAGWVALFISIGTGITALLSFAKGFQKVTEHFRQKGYARIWADPSTASPKPPAAPDPERASMLLRIAEQEKRTAELTVLWKQSAADAKIKELENENEARRVALAREHAINAELLRANAALREENAGLRIERGHLLLALDHDPDVIDVAPIDDFGEERAPTLRPPRLLNAPPKDSR